MLGVRTESGSVYIFRANGRLVYYGGRCLNARTSPLHNDEWRRCEVTPWPPVIGESMEIKRPTVPWGEGCLTRTSPVHDFLVGEGLASLLCSMKGGHTG